MGKYNKNKSQKFALRQKQAIRIIDNDTVRRTTGSMEKLKILNIYKINLY